MKPSICCANCGIASSNYGQSTGITSWAHKHNGDVLCWDCARETDIETLTTGSSLFAYVSDYDLTTFPGRILGRILTKGKWNHNAFGGAKWRSIYGKVGGIHVYGREYSTQDCIHLRIRKRP